jgi:hypothetical protein
MFGHIGVLDLSLSPRHLIRLKYSTIMKLDFMHVLRSISFWLVAFCLTKSLLCNVVILSGMLYISESSKVFQKSFSSVQRKILCRFQLREVESQVSVQIAQSCIRTPFSVEKLRTVQNCIRPDVMATRLDAL